MAYTTFNQNKTDHLKEPLFFGENVNISRYDINKYPIFTKLIDKQLSQFWRPEEVDLSQDRKQFYDLPNHERHIFISNLKYQILLDSVQGRSPNVALLPVVSNPELESWIELWSANEVVHSLTYTHIIRNIFNDPSEVFDTIVETPEIMERASAVTKYYDDFIESTRDWENFKEIYTYDSSLTNREYNTKLYELKRKLYRLIAAINILEGVRFYVSFACTFSFAERKLMEGNAKEVKLIARDENLHMAGTQHILKLLPKDDSDFTTIAEEEQLTITKMFLDAAEQEMIWAEYLFKDGSTIGLNAVILKDYVKYITDKRMKAIKLTPIFNVTVNPLPWMDNWLTSDATQIAPQESEITSYLVGAIDNNIDKDEFGGFEL